MNNPELFQLFGLALGLTPPWQVSSVDYEAEAGELEIGLDFPRGSRFACAVEGCANTACKVHDRLDKRWRHLDFFEHKAYLATKVPRVRCVEHGVHLVSVPWAREGSGFTLLMEVAMLTFAAQMPIAAVAKSAREHDTRVWRVIEHHVQAARAAQDLSGVRALGMDETSAKRGQDYVSIFMDLDARRVIFATPGRDSATVGAFATDLAAHGGEPKTQLDEVCCDMSNAYVKGIAEHLSEHGDDSASGEGTSGEGAPVAAMAGARPGGAGRSAPAPEDQSPPGEARFHGGEPEEALHRPQITFDRYHVVAKANEAVDAVRRAEAKSRPELRNSRYVWLKNQAKLSAKQRGTLAWLSRPSMNLATARAARWRDDFNGFYAQATPEEAEAYLRRWCYGAKRSRLEPIKDFVRTVEAHWDGIIAWQKNRLSNGLLEGTNSLIQAAKRRARGYSSKEKMITIIYLIAGKLPLPQIHTI